VLVPSAAAKSFDLVSAEVRVDVLPNGTLSVAEDIQFAFSGDFTYAYRDIPVRSGERLEVIGVREPGVEYRPGASTDLEPGGPPGSYGVEEHDDYGRVVWRFRARDEARTFTVRYRLSGLAVAYDDVVDVHLKVWGDEWDQRLGRLAGIRTG